MSWASLPAIPLCALGRLRSGDPFFWGLGLSFLAVSFLFACFYLKGEGFSQNHKKDGAAVSQNTD